MVSGLQNAVALCDILIVLKMQFYYFYYSETSILIPSNSLTERLIDGLAD